MNNKLGYAMADKGDSQQDVANICGLRSYVSIYNRINGKTPWKEREIKILCKRYHKTREELGL